MKCDVCQAELLLIDQYVLCPNGHGRLRHWRAVFRMSGDGNYHAPDGSVLTAQQIEQRTIVPTPLPRPRAVTRQAGRQAGRRKGHAAGDETE